MTAAPELVEGVAELLRRRTGLVFGESRRASFRAALARVRSRSGSRSEDEYLRRVAAEPALLDDLVGEVTVGETYFYREPQQLAVIRDTIIPALWSARGHETRLRCWSAGCASGEEPYTLAMLFDDLGALGRVDLLGTDLSRGALARAQRGVYSRWSFRGVPPSVLTRFLQVGDRYTLVPQLREAVRFGYLNLAEDIYPSLVSGIQAMDLILCRNVLIYFDRDTVRRVAARLLDSLSGDGWLMLGSSDPILSDLIPCEVILTPAGLAYRRPAPGRPAVSGRFPEFRETEEPADGPIVPSWPAPSLRGHVGAAAQYLPQADPTAEADRGEYLLTARPASEPAGVAPAAVLVEDDATAEALVARIRALANRGELAAADRACAAAVDRHPDSAELQYLQGLMLEAGGHHEAAATAARRALYLDRGMIVAHVALGTALARLGDRPGACRSLANADRLLATMPLDDPVTASDGVSAGRLAQMVQTQLRLISREAT